MPHATNTLLEHRMLLKQQGSLRNGAIASDVLMWADWQTLLSWRVSCEAATTQHMHAACKHS